jgi:hypothetical protein
VTTEAAHPLIVVPHGNVSPMRYLVGLFLLAWLWRSHPDHRPGSAAADKSPSAPLALVEALLLRPLMNDLQSRA